MEVADFVVFPDYVIQLSELIYLESEGIGDPTRFGGLVVFFIDLRVLFLHLGILPFEDESLLVMKFLEGAFFIISEPSK